MSIVSDVRHAVATKLQTLLPDERIHEEWVPTVEREDMAHRDIFVNAETRETTLIARGCKQTKITIIVGVMEPFEQGYESSAAEACSVLIDTVIDGMLAQKVGSAVCTEAKQPLLISPEHWRDYRQFTGLVALTMVVS